MKGLISVFLFLNLPLYAEMPVGLPNSGIVSEEVDSFYDPQVDYSKFSGRITDRDDQVQIFKIKSENPQIKFFKSGDVVEFNVSKMEVLDRDYRYPCKGFVRNVEQNYLTLFVNNLRQCWNPREYLRRGTVLIFFSSILAERVLNASKFRRIVIKEKQDFLKQLDKVNQFLWNYDQERLKLAADFDKKMIELQKMKDHDLTHLVDKKEEFVRLQAKLQRKLDELDKNLDLYRIEAKELFFDRWHEDQDTSAPVVNRPYENVKDL